MKTHLMMSRLSTTALILFLSFVAVVFLYLLLLSSPFSEKIPLCPSKDVSELEHSVTQYFSRKSDTLGNFSRTHKFKQDQYQFMESSNLWSVPFSMFDPKTRRDRNYVAIVTCNGGIELTILD